MPAFSAPPGPSRRCLVSALCRSRWRRGNREPRMIGNGLWLGSPEISGREVSPWTEDSTGDEHAGHRFTPIPSSNLNPRVWATCRPESLSLPLPSLPPSLYSTRQLQRRRQRRWRRRQGGLARSRTRRNGGASCRPTGRPIREGRCAAPPAPPCSRAAVSADAPRAGSGRGSGCPRGAPAAGAAGMHRSPGPARDNRLRFQSAPAPQLRCHPDAPVSARGTSGSSSSK